MIRRLFRLPAVACMFLVMVLSKRISTVAAFSSSSLPVGTHVGVTVVPATISNTVGWSDIRVSTRVLASTDADDADDDADDDVCAENAEDDDDVDNEVGQGQTAYGNRSLAWTNRYRKLIPYESARRQKPWHWASPPNKNGHVLGVDPI